MAAVKLLSVVRQTKLNRLALTTEPRIASPAALSFEYRLVGANAMLQFFFLVLLTFSRPFSVRPQAVEMRRGFRFVAHLLHPTTVVRGQDPRPPLLSLTGA